MQSTTLETVVYSFKCFKAKHGIGDESFKI